MSASKPSAETRRDTYIRDKGRCVRCGQKIDSGFVMSSLHHRRLRSHPFPGLHEPSNLIWLCGSGTTGCHGWVHSHPEESYKLGFMVHSYEDPAKMPVKCYPDTWYYLDGMGLRHRAGV